MWFQMLDIDRAAMSRADMELLRMLRARGVELEEGAGAVLVRFLGGKLAPMPGPADGPYRDEPLTKREHEHLDVGIKACARHGGSFSAEEYHAVFAEDYKHRQRSSQLPADFAVPSSLSTQRYRKFFRRVSLGRYEMLPAANERGSRKEESER